MSVASTLSGRQGEIGQSKASGMNSDKKARITALLTSIQTGDPEPIAVVDQSKYIQHNPQTHEGSEGLETLFKRLSQTNPRVNIVRAFEDGDFVFAHTEYDFSRRNIGFEVFRFEGDRAVEHWDNIQKRMGPNRSGHSMVDGPRRSQDLDLGETNRQIVSEFVQTVLVQRQIARLENFVSPDFVEHNPTLEDGLASLQTALNTRDDTGFQIRYDRLHRVLAEGSFVLSVSEGAHGGLHASYYDLFRLENGLIVEHWDTRENVPPQSEWKNDNGKF